MRYILALALLASACSSSSRLALIAVEHDGSRNGIVVIRFDRPVDPATVNAANVSIPDAVGALSVVGNEVRFEPRLPVLADTSDAGLEPDRAYEVTVSADVRGLDGSGMGGTFAATIATGPGFSDPVEGALAVASTTPAQGESGVGTIVGIGPGPCAVFVRLDPIVIEFDQPVAPPSVAGSVTVRNLTEPDFRLQVMTKLLQGGAGAPRIELAVEGVDTPFENGVLLGRYEVVIDGLTDLGGAALSFTFSFSTVAQVSLPTDVRFSFADDDADGGVDVGGLATAINDTNELPSHVGPFLGGLLTRQPGVDPASPLAVETTANWGGVAYWTGREMRYNNATSIAASLRLRGGTVGAATPVLSPLAGTGANGDLLLTGTETRDLFTGDATTGPIAHHFRRIRITATDAGRPVLKGHGLFPLVLFAEEDAVITGDIDVRGVQASGEAGGAAGPGGGPGGDANERGASPHNVHGAIAGATSGQGAAALDPSGDFTDPDVLACGGAGGQGAFANGGGGGGGLVCLASAGDLVLAADGHAASVHANGGAAIGGAQSGGDGGIVLVSGGTLTRGGATLDVGSGGRIYLADAPGTGGIEVYGDEPREPGFGRSQIVSEFLDMFADASTLDSVRVLSNAPRFPYDIADAAQRTIRVFVDSTDARPDGSPDLDEIRTIEIDLHVRTPDGAATSAAQFEAFAIVPSDADPARFWRVRIVFDLANVGDPDALKNTFALPGAATLPIAPDNSFADQTEAPEGVPAVSEIRLRITPGC